MRCRISHQLIIFLVSQNVYNSRMKFITVFVIAKTIETPKSHIRSGHHICCFFLCSCIQFVFSFEPKKSEKYRQVVVQRDRPLIELHNQAFVPSQLRGEITFAITRREERRLRRRSERLGCVCVRRTLLIVEFVDDFPEGKFRP